MSHNKDSYTISGVPISTAALRLGIDKLQQRLTKASAREAKTMRRQIRRLAAIGMAQFNAERPHGPSARRRANTAARERRDDKILSNRSPYEYTMRMARRNQAAGVVKPVFEK